MATNYCQGEKDNQRFLERCFAILEYLRRNTDSEHVTNQKNLRLSKTGIEAYLGNSGTFPRTIRQLAAALNFNEVGVKPKDEWVLVYKAFAQDYNDDDEFCDDGYNDDDSKKKKSVTGNSGEKGKDTADETVKRRKSVTGIYFNHMFSEDELTDIINALHSSKAVSSERSKNLIKKLKDRLASNFYKDPACKLDFSEFTDSPQLAENIKIIQRAISEHKKLSFTFNYYDQDKRLVPTAKGQTLISPHYIVSDKGRIYLIGSFDNNKMYNYRADLMTDLSITELSAAEKHKIRDLPTQMSSEFMVKHLLMSYETPIRVRFKNTKTNGDGTPNYTFIHDYFGGNFNVIDKKNNIVETWCSKFGIINLAVQYGQYIEVLDEDLRRDISERLKTISEKYI